MSETDEKKTGGVRVAVEGCGHGTLHAIYASIEQACAVKGWDGVDLLIIGGDFQAVRNQHDLNVTAMPAKYRQMADFHEYYSGARTAPYLTIFIGGNHEASNHLFELYYGGWVAPNIYYMGAANVLQFGPLRIAGLTGIWKGYDYRKPHFERLPYNQEEITSIFHVRELDVRKLLCLRSQIDIGLSHDWPQGVEYHGDYNWLFQKKPDFGTDSYAGKLGSVAARQCLDRLRPPYWFSAHLHTKFAAAFPHNDNPASLISTTRTHPAVAAKKSQSHLPQVNATYSGDVAAPLAADRAQVSAWQNFHAVAKQENAEERDKIRKAQAEREDEEAKTGVKVHAGYSYNETFDAISPDKGLERKIISTTQTQINSPEAPKPIPQLDGCFYSRPSKRQRIENEDMTSPDRVHPSLPQLPFTTATGQIDGANASVFERARRIIANPDAIDIDMSDDDETTVVGTPRTEPRRTGGSQTASTSNGTNLSTSFPGDDEDGGVLLEPPQQAPVVRTPEEVESAARLTDFCRALSQIVKPRPQAVPTQPALIEETEDTPDTSTEMTNGHDHTAEGSNEISEEMRAQLAALSSNFTPKEQVEVSPALPFPEEIANKTTRFLALGKCEQYQEFLQLLEIESTTSPDANIQRPLKLSYDPEWLAIQRVFAPELHLGGVATDKVSPDRGETYYREQSDKERAWITEHVVVAGKLQVPENFVVTAPIYDPSLQVESNAMPREYTNPQTSAYCDLIGIENKFDVSEEERDFRMQQGPRPESENFREYRDRGRQGRGGGGNRGRGGHRGGGGAGHGRGGGGGRGWGQARGRGRGRGW